VCPQFIAVRDLGRFSFVVRRSTTRR
jgi:hypothetical protein